MTQDIALAWARRHLRWFVCLCLLLPLGQVAGAVHALSHLDPASASQRQDGALIHDHCAICVVAASLAGGSPASMPTLASAQAAPLAPIAEPALPVAADRPVHHRNRGPPALLS